MNSIARFSSHFHGPAAMALITTAALAGGTGCSGYRGQAFATPEDATREFVAALRPYDAARVREVLGKKGPEVLTSGDEIGDRNDLEKFLAAYDTRHQLVTEEDGSMTLEVGDRDWPMPIPLVEAGGSWRFDTQRGEEEILARRIGRNELATIQVCLAIVDAQREYAMTDPDGDGAGDYAPQLISDPGRRNGLFWEAAEGQPPSPLGELVADARAEGYAASRGSGPQSATSRPYHGYRYRILDGQGPSAAGGARSYMTGGRMTGGFAVIAYPAAYDDSGITTFMVDQHGVVYQCDLGRDTARVADKMTTFDPGRGWTVVDLDQP
jgi:hypothetical protein